MADKEFEEFRQFFEQLPQHIKAPSNCYTLAHDIALESPSPEDAPDPPDPPSGKSPCTCSDSSSHGSSNDKSKVSKCCSDEDPCCPQLPPDPSSCGGTTDLMAELAGLGGGGGGEALDHIMGTDSPICGSPAPRRPRPRPEGSSGPSSVESEDHLEINMNLASEFGALSYLDDGDDADEDPGTPAEDEEGGASRPLKPRPSGEQRKRRKLPEIPKNKNSFSCASLLALRSGPNLADELAEVESGVASRSSTPDTLSLINSRPLLLLKCAANLRDDSCSPDSDLQLPLNDIDSGHSTQHSPDGAKSMSPQATVNGSLSPMSPSSGGGGVPFPQLELLEATHRGLYRFIPRHHDEVDIEIGDAIYVQKEAEDLWCEGVNLRSGRQGIFPAAHVTDVDYSDFDPSVPKVKKERYLLNYLGSIETLCHKGNQVLCQAVRKIAGGKEIAHAPHPCILEVSDQGIRMVDKSKPTGVRGPCHDYFYHLKHVSFCAFHPGDHRYFGFITKHPRSQRFACHVFRSNENTRPVAEAVGRAFQRFYQKFIETAYPIEDIYLE